MKRVLKSQEPQSLQGYRQAQPGSTWEALRNDSQNGGKKAYVDIRQQTLQDQGGLCAYCELDIRENNSLQSRVEHFHPKSDHASAINWALEWTNMLAVCAGGSYKHAAAPHSLKPLPDNLSCDAHKDQMIQTHKLAEHCDGWVLNPQQLPALPSLFALQKSSGKISADLQHCNSAPVWPLNHHVNVQALVEHTIDILNLNCDRLCQARLRIVRDIERNKKKQRDAGYSPQQGLGNLARHYLRPHWPGFFTTICLCLGNAAEEHLQQIQYQG